MIDRSERSLRSSAEADSDSGILETNTATTMAALTPPGSSTDRPIAADSGMPSSTAPTTMGTAPPPLMTRLTAKNVRAPAARPLAAASAPPVRNASPARSNDAALISTPAPNAITAPTTRPGTWTTSAMPAPTRRAKPPTKPQNAASSTRRGYRPVPSPHGRARADRGPGRAEDPGSRRRRTGDQARRGPGVAPRPEDPPDGVLARRDGCLALPGGSHTAGDPGLVGQPPADRALLVPRDGGAPGRLAGVPVGAPATRPAHARGATGHRLAARGQRDRQGGTGWRRDRRGAAIPHAGSGGGATGPGRVRPDGGQPPHVRHRPGPARVRDPHVHPRLGVAQPDRGHGRRAPRLPRRRRRRGGVPRAGRPPGLGRAHRAARPQPSAARVAADHRPSRSSAARARPHPGHGWPALEARRAGGGRPVGVRLRHAAGRAGRGRFDSPGRARPARLLRGP